MKGGDRSIVAQLRRSPAKSAMLGLFLLGALWIWSGTLLGSDEPPPRPIVDYNAQLRAAGLITGPGAAPGPTGPVATFDDAMARLKTWRAVLEGWKPAPVPDDIADPTKARKRVELELTGTVILGGSRCAVFNGARVKEGNRYGRYTLLAVRPREVDLLDGNRLITLRMPDPVAERHSAGEERHP